MNSGPYPHQVDELAAVLRLTLVLIDELAARLGGDAAGLFVEDGWAWRTRELRTQLDQLRAEFKLQEGDE